ncbi:MAG TPA: hypothetical protein PLD54_01880 [Candidatus Levybacteria bacterium]|nr:hypothetical protein [Candidatus Levybacteria bacterium]
MVQKFKNWVKKVPDRKIYIEVVTALLTVPVLITVLVTNLNNLSEMKKDKADAAQVTPATQEIIIKDVPSAGQSAQTTITEKIISTQPCKKEVGPINISYPAQGQTVTENPVNIHINYSDSEYCSVVWSYRINDGQWSEYSSNSISLYNMPEGAKKLELRVQSTTSNDQELLTREFNYTPSSTPEASGSAN